uniref:NADP-dependent oxidoreductase domain-containing protein n=1 Tax=Plectus sambesii TaxID=2011161 RepID=A0A914WYD9_9BILA
MVLSVLESSSHHVDHVRTSAEDDFCAFRPEIQAEFVENWTTDAVPVIPSTVLPNGIAMPMLGLGTTHSGGYYHETVVYALRNCHYRMIDTAKRYGVEKKLSLAIKESGVPRKELFLTSKLWPVDFGYESTREACRGSCERLGTDYLDLYVIHFPEIPRWFEQPRLIREETWRALERLYDDGVCRAIGVSNYNQKDLEELLEFCSIKPHVNQCEFHPYINPMQLREFCKEENIMFTGYCPLAKGKILDEEVIKRVATKHNKTAAQVCLRWSVENGVPAIPKSRQSYRIRQNCDIFDFALDESDMESLANLHDPSRKCVKLENLQEKYSLPDGYKLNGISSICDNSVVSFVS